MPNPSIEKLPPCTVATTNSDFAAAMMTHGGRCREWRERDGRVEWTIDGIPAGAVERYKDGSDLLSVFSRNRRLLREISRSFLSGDGQSKT